MQQGLLCASSITKEPAVQGCSHVNLGDQGKELPHTSDVNPGTDSNQDGLMQSIAVMQKFLLKQGLIDKPINQEEVKQLLMSENNEKLLVTNSQQ